MNTTYVKKPVPIHAQRINGQPFEPWLQPYGESGELFLKVGPSEDGKWWMKTKHGLVSADTGDWILQAVDGEIYPCSDEVFRATYDVQQIYRHKKRGTEYVLIGIGKMQAERWMDVDPEFIHDQEPVDMREVAVYRSVLDPAEIWVRPREEFEDGRFEVVAKQ